MLTPEHKLLIETLRRKGISNSLVLDAMSSVLRHEFVPIELRHFAYEDHAFAIGHAQTISQPYIVACMTELLLGDKTHLKNVLEIGTGSGYQAAVLSALCDHVYTIERIKALYDLVDQRLRTLHYDNVHCRYDDGRKGWEEHAPYDGIIVTAASVDIPGALKNQLADGARLVIPVAEERSQFIQVITRVGKEFRTATHEQVIFVPLKEGKEDE